MDKVLAALFDDEVQNFCSSNCSSSSSSSSCSSCSSSSDSDTVMSPSDSDTEDVHIVKLPTVSEEDRLRAIYQRQVACYPQGSAYGHSWERSRSRSRSPPLAAAERAPPSPPFYADFAAQMDLLRTSFPDSVRLHCERVRRAALEAKIEEHRASLRGRWCRLCCTVHICDGGYPCVV